MAPLHANPDAQIIGGRIDIEKDRSLTRVLVVETGLAINALSPGYDDEAIRRLAGDVQAAMGDQFDRAEIVPMMNRQIPASA